LALFLLFVVLTDQIWTRTDEQYPRRQESLLRAAERRILSETYVGDPRTVEQKIPGNFELPTVGITDDSAASLADHFQPAAADDVGNAGRRITICGRKTGPLPELFEPGSEEPNAETQMEAAFRQYVTDFAEKANVRPMQGALLLNNEPYGRTGNMMREFFHGLDVARHHGLIPVIHDSIFPIENDLTTIFPFLDLDEIRRIFGVKIVGDPGLDLDMQAYNGVKSADLLNFGGKLLSLRREIFPKSEIKNIILNRRRIIQQMFELMEARADVSEEAQAMCGSIQAASIRQDTRYTVIHSRSFAKEGRPKFFTDHHLAAMGVDTTGPIKLHPSMISAILNPLRMASQPLFMITDGRDETIANRLSSHPYYSNNFRLAPEPGGDIFSLRGRKASAVSSDLIFAVMSDVFIGHPMSSFSTLIAQIRYALGFRHTYLHARRVDGKWETFCEDEECFYSLHNV